jgi:glycosyltransferase involved in cell wall biosynthesis
MACGCCAVASDTGGNPELVKPGETGLLFKPRDPDDLASALRILIERPDLRRDMATRGERFLSNFSIASAARRMGEIYTSLVR